ncbi:hypothetical protein TWF694_009511 [Orbilia ellipsospora]|uniref:F-box domain-containing protein n=1 Tax=Orbilia ellipsospora TaxID=2528407 RepID=A0AAV9XC87_9PEZI
MEDNGSLLSRKFAQLSTRVDSNPYIQKPKPKLDNLPLELLLQVSCQLDDVRSALNLSFASRSLYESLAGSQYFWFRYGNRDLKRFREFNRNFDYHDYIVRAKSGKIKSTCQICLTPRRGVVRKELGYVVCTDCLYKNIILRSTVERITDIAAIDFSKCIEIKVRYPGADSPLNDYFWLPVVKRIIEARYRCSWEHAMKQYLFDIRNFASPTEITDYVNHQTERVIEAATSIFRLHHENLLRPYLPFLDRDTFRVILEAMGDQLPITPIKNQISALGVPSGYQENPADDDWVHDRAKELIQGMLGPQVPGHPPHVRTYSRSHIWGMLYNGLINRLTSAGQRLSLCNICMRSSSPYFHSFSMVYFAADGFIDHVQNYHPDRLLYLNWDWKL